MGLDLPLPKKCKLMDLLAEKTNGKFNNFFNKEHKIHTIRHDGKNRWKTGNKIHMVINNRTKDRFQFAPVLECKSVQKIEIKYHDKITKHWQYLIHGKNVSIKVNGHPLAYFDLCALCFNDGFPTVESFFNWFDKSFEGKIIHWTDLKY